MITGGASTRFLMRGLGAGLSIVMGGGGVGGLGGWRDILCRDGIGIGMGMSIRRVTGMMLFMGCIRDRREVGGVWVEVECHSFG